MEKTKCDYCTGDFDSKDIYIGARSQICSGCIKALGSLLKDGSPLVDGENNVSPTIMELLTDYKPEKVIKYLDKYIIQQSEAKEVMSISFYNHYKRMILKDPDIQKSNVLLIGPSGTGKTLISHKISELLELPFVTVDATKFTEAGYVGSDVEDILTELYINSNEDVSKAEYGIVHIDEWDKLSEPAKASHHVNKRGVQQSFLKMIEGGDFYISTKMNKKDMDSEKIKINTKNILFICSGAFEGIYDIVKKRLDPSSKIGFASKLSSDSKNDYWFVDKVEDSDFIKYGMMKEIVARLPFKTFVRELTQDDLKRIITEPKDSIISGYKKLLSLDNATIEFDESAIDEFASIAFNQKTGARALKSIMDKRLKDVMIEASKKSKKTKINIDKDYVSGNKKATDVFS